jgi:chromate transporter
MIQDEVVRNGWLTQGTLVDFIAISESTPGPFAVNIATFVGMETGGIFGAACATFGVVLPSFVIILLIAKCFMCFKDNRYVAGAMGALRPAAVGLIGSAVLSIAAMVILPANWTLRDLGALLRGINYRAIIITVIIFLIFKYKNLHPAYLMMISAALGILLFGFLTV